MTIVFGTGATPLTWAQARSKVRGDLWRPGSTGIPDDVCDRALHAACRRLESERRWLWLQNIQATLTAPTDTAELLAPTDLQSVSSLAYLSGTTGYDVLRRAPVQRVRNDARGPYVGFPDSYAYLPGTLYLNAAVRTGAVFELIYKSQTPDEIELAIAEAPPTLWLKQTAVIAAASAEVAGGFLKNDDEFVRQERRYQRQLETLINEEDEARSDESGGFVQPDLDYHVAAFGAGAR